jgi:uncharacterized protein YecT (DUF1311 family)
MKTAGLIAYLFLLFTSFHVNAQSTSEYDSMYGKCVDENGPINNSVVARCSETVSNKAKSEITRRYKSIHARLLSKNPEDAGRFERSQKAWLQYRNIHCDLAGAYIGSPMHGFCQMNLNSARALELRELDGEQT